MRSGFLFKFGDAWQNVDGLSAQESYKGTIIGIWQIQANDHEPAHIDILAVPEAIFGAFVAIARGGDAAKAMIELDSAARVAASNKQVPPSAMRRIVYMDEGPVAFVESTLSLQEAMTHFNDRNNTARSAYLFDDEDEDEEEEETPATAAPPANGAPPPPIAQPAQPQWPTQQY